MGCARLDKCVIRNVLGGLGLAASLAIASPSRAQEPAQAQVQEPAPSAADAELPPALVAEPEHPQDARFELAARGGYASAPIRGGITPLGLGGGAGLGLIVSNFYVGGAIVNYAGGSDDTGASEHALLYGVELGYELRLGELFALRPMMGFGGASITDSIPNGTTAAAGTSSATGTPRGRASAVDVVTQATSISSGGSGGTTVSPTTDTTVDAFYLEPGLTLLFGRRTGAVFGLSASALYLPKVSYDASSSVSWLSYSMSARLGLRF